MKSHSLARVLAVASIGAATLVATPLATHADDTPGTLPFTQDWSVAPTADWATPLSVVGHRGDGLTATNRDPRTVLADGAGTPVNLLVAAQGASSTTGGIHYIGAAGAVALQGSGTATSPHLVIHLDTTGQTGINVDYDLVHLDDDDSVQPVALQYRVGGTGPYANVDGGFVADAASTPSGTLTPVSALLPPAADNQSMLQIRIITTDAAGSDAMIGIDNISITSGGVQPPAEPVAECPATVVTSEGVAASADVSATDADSTIADIAVVSPPVEGISLTVTGPGTATLDVAATTAIGSHPVDIRFSTDDETAQTVTCRVTVHVTPDPATITIGDIQGSGQSSPRVGQFLTVGGTVTSLFTSQDVLDGYFMQDGGDGDDTTSDGIFVFCGGSCPTGLAVGDAVLASGPVGEYFGMTQISANANGATTVASSDNPLPEPTPIDLPANGSTKAAATFESTEGMLVEIPQTLAVSEYFELARYGQIVLTAGERPAQFTDTNPPDPAGYQAFLADLEKRRIILDDDNNDQNDTITGAADEATPWPSGGLSVDNRFRGGDTITGLTGVLHWSFAGQSNTDAWRIRPVDGVDYTFTPTNPVPPMTVEGDLRVASFNVLNYFTSIDETSSSNSGPCGPDGAQDCRGADSLAELDAQRAKIVDAIVEIDPAIAGLIEIQNDEGESVDDLVAGLNSATGADTYAAIDIGFVGTDVIKQAFIYQPAVVAPVGQPAILDTSVDPRFLDTENRPMLVQTFRVEATGEVFTVAVNHLKSKGSDCSALGDLDLGDGAGNCNITRTDAAAAIVDYLATDPTGSEDPDFLIIGDLNAYRMEDPITTLTSNGYTDLVDRFESDDAYSYVFDGQLGYLDHALSSASLTPQVADVTTWHINADEIPLFDYNDDIRDVGESAFERETSVGPLDDLSALRSSDHDPVVIGLDLGVVDPEDQPLRLTLLHNNDGESALLPNDETGIGGIARFSTLVDELRTEAAGEPGNADSLLVSSGDNFLAGLALQASLENYDGDTDYSDDGPFYDALALDHLGYDASAVGNHEFDFGPNVLGYFMSQFDTSNIRFVSANLDVTGDAALEQFVAASPGEPGTLVEWTRAEAGGRRVAIVGATTPLLPTISSPGPNVTVDPDVLGAVQGAIDEATADGTEIVILISHLQNIAEDQALIAELSGLDIAVAGGGDELLANDDDILLPDSIAPYGPYPILQVAADGNDVPIVTTQGSYGYVGRLIVDIDADGEVTAVDGRSGPVRNATEDGVVPDPWVVDNVEAPVQAYIDDLATQVVAHTVPALDGRRAFVRTQETNLGSFFADALREAAALADDRFGATNPTVALQNSGGIRNDSVIGPDVDVTAEDVFTIAPFENFLSYVPDVTPEKLKELMERSVSAGLVNGALAAEGRFGQISGMNVVYDPTRQAQVIDATDPLDVVVVTPGERVRQLTLTLDPDDPSDDIVVVRNGQVVAGAPNVDLAGNSFTIASNGDAYPFNLDPSEIVNLGTTYRQALQDKFVREGTVTAAEYPEGGLGRITVGGDVPVEPDLRVDDAALTFPRRLPGTAVVTGGVDDTYTRCPRLGLTIDGTEVVDVRTFNLFGVCLGLGRGGLVTFDRGASDFAVLGGLPRGFTLADADVDFELTLDDTSYAATVPGTLTASRWTAN